jgi:hypothetical protein
MISRHGLSPEMPFLIWETRISNPFMVLQAHHGRKQLVTVRPEPVEEVGQRLLGEQHNMLNNIPSAAVLFRPTGGVCRRVDLDTLVHIRDRDTAVYGVICRESSVGLVIDEVVVHNRLEVVGY